MKTTNLCGRPGCGGCPKLVTDRKGGKLSFQIVDDDGTTINLKSDEARNFALAVFKEIGK